MKKSEIKHLTSGGIYKIAFATYRICGSVWGVYQAYLRLKRLLTNRRYYLIEKNIK